VQVFEKRHGGTAWTNFHSTNIRLSFKSNDIALIDLFNTLGTNHSDKLQTLFISTHSTDVNYKESIISFQQNANAFKTKPMESWKDEPSPRLNPKP